MAKQNHRIKVRINPVPAKGKHQADPPKLQVNGTHVPAGDTVQWTLQGAPAGVNSIWIWFPDPQKVFKAPPNGFKFPILLDSNYKDSDQFEVLLTINPHRFVPYVMYCVDTMEFIQGESEPQVDV